MKNQNYSRKAKFDTVRFDEEAVKFHCEKYEHGIKYPLSLACYQMTKIAEMKAERLKDDS